MESAERISDGAPTSNWLLSAGTFVVQFRPGPIQNTGAADEVIAPSKFGGTEKRGSSDKTMRKSHCLNCSGVTCRREAVWRLVSIRPSWSFTNSRLFMSE